MPRRALPALIRYAIAAGVFALLIGLARGSRALFGFSVDITSVIIVTMIASAWYLGLGPGLLVAALLEGVLDYNGRWAVDPLRSAVISFNRIVLFGSVVWFASSRRRAEQRLEQQQTALADALAGERKARAEAERANRLKDEFLATVSHELRTPLNVMLGWAAMLNRHNVDGHTIKRAADAIERSARSQTQIVGDILDTSRIVTGQLSLEEQPLELGTVVREAVETLSVAASAKSLVLHIDTEPEARVLGDALRLRQVAWNLLVNAMKFTPPGGTIDISVRRDGASVALVVRDSGVGIDPAFLPRLFERFTQADSSMTREYGGLGLGLAIVRHLVELHGGTVAAHSAGLDAGATFTVRLPAHGVASGSASVSTESAMTI